MPRSAGERVVSERDRCGPSEAIDAAWDAVQFDGEGGLSNPEAEALRALWGKSAFRILEDIGIEWSFDGDEIEIVEAVQKFIAEKYLHAKSVK
jgi:hypothetical protein